MERQNIFSAVCRNNPHILRNKINGYLSNGMARIISESTKLYSKKVVHVCVVVRWACKMIISSLLP